MGGNYRQKNGAETLGDEREAKGVVVVARKGNDNVLREILLSFF